MGYQRNVIDDSVVLSIPELSLELKLPAIVPANRSEEELIAWLYREWCCVAYKVMVGCINIADEAVQTGNVPSRETFIELTAHLARDDRHQSAIGEVVVSFQYPFGVATERTDNDTFQEAIPVLAALPRIAEFMSSLRSDGANLSSAAKHLAGHIASELNALSWTIHICFLIYRDLDSAGMRRIAPQLSGILLRAASIPGLRRRVAIAAEFAGYLLMREAQTTGDDVLEAGLRDAAVASFHHAFEHAGDPRLAKYIAENLIDIALQRNDRHLREIAEHVWVNSYIWPYVHSLTEVPTMALSHERWEQVTEIAEGLDPLAKYTLIQPYSKDPDLLYSGWAHARLSSSDSTFTSDLWAAAIILVQRFKDLPDAPGISGDEADYRFFDPDGEEVFENFPLVLEHPVAWFWMLADALYQFNRTTVPHAGLCEPFPPTWSARRQLELAIDHFTAAADGTETLRTWRFAPTAFADQALRWAPLYHAEDAPLASRWRQAIHWWSDPLPRR